MELRQLRYFVAVAEAGNISRAAQKIFLTQPALSRQIKALEGEIGQCLLKREAHSISLTPAGEALLEEARALLQQADEIPDRIRRSAQKVRLRVGYAPSLASGILSVAVENFTQKHAEAQVEIFDLSTKEMLSGLENGTLDLALTVSSGDGTRGLSWIPLLRSSWCVAVSRQNPLARKTKVTKAAVSREKLLVFCQKDYPEYWKLVGDWLKKDGHRPAIAGEYDGVNSLLAGVESGLGVALVTNCSLKLAPERVRLKPIADGPEPISIGAALKAGRESEKPVGVLIGELKAAAAGFEA
jgi:DNA-binding transcriptional LysR family regulator